MRRGVVGGRSIREAADASLRYALLREPFSIDRVTAKRRGGLLQSAQSADDEVVSGLFLRGEQSLWLDPSDIGTMYQSLGTTATPVTGLEQPVGCIQDKSNRYGLFAAFQLAHRPVLSARINELVGTEVLSTQAVATIAAEYVLRFDGTGSVTLSGTASETLNAGVYVVTATAGELTVTVSGEVLQADLRLLTDTTFGWPEYQSVTSTTDYDAHGFPRFLRFDGVDDNFGGAFAGNVAGTYQCSTESYGLCSLSAINTLFHINRGTIGNRTYNNGSGRTLLTEFFLAVSPSSVLEVGVGGSRALPFHAVMTNEIKSGHAGVSRSRDIINQENTFERTDFQFGPFVDSGFGYSLRFNNSAGFSQPFRGRLYQFVWVGRELSLVEVNALQSYIYRKMAAL
jgi:hypothetical protein